jgi:hypothetical protein
VGPQAGKRLEVVAGVAGSRALTGKFDTSQESHQARPVLIQSFHFKL